MNALSVQLDQLQDAQLVRPLVEDEPAYIFRHVLTQETEYQSLRLKDRREIHRHVAQTSERLAADRLDVVAAGRSLEQAKRPDGRHGWTTWSCRLGETRILVLDLEQTYA